MALYCDYCKKYYQPHLCPIGCECEGAKEARRSALHKQIMSARPAGPAAILLSNGRPKLKLTKKGKITHTVELTGKDIMDLMAQNGTDYTPGADATVEFKVPDGGDWSGMRIEFSEVPFVVVTWTKET